MDRRGDGRARLIVARVFGVEPDLVSKEMRRKAKVINFGIIYGMGVNALKANLNSTREEAQEFYDQYFITFPKIADYFAFLWRTPEPRHSQCIRHQ